MTKDSPGANSALVTLILDSNVKISKIIFISLSYSIY